MINVQCNRKIQVASFKRQLILNFATGIYIFGIKFGPLQSRFCCTEPLATLPSCMRKVSRVFFRYNLSTPNSRYVKQRNGKRFCFARGKFENLAKIQRVRRWQLFFFFFFRISKVTRGEKDRCCLLRNVLSN